MSPLPVASPPIGAAMQGAQPPAAQRYAYVNARSPTAQTQAVPLAHSIQDMDEFDEPQQQQPPPFEPALDDEWDEQQGHEGDPHDAQHDQAGAEHLDDVPLPVEGALVDDGGLAYKSRFHLYASYALASWGDRMWEFSAIVFIVNLYPTTLFYSALFGLVENLVGIVFGPYVGALIDVHDRLRVLNWSIVGQNVSIALASLVFWMALTSLDSTSGAHPKSEAFIGLSYLFILCMGGTAQVASTANKVSLHKDWLVVVAATSPTRLTALNSTMRRINLTANILAPVLVGLVSWGASPAVAVMCVGIWSVLSLLVELMLARRVYWKIEPLRHKPKAEAAEQARRLAAEAAAAEGSASSSSARSFAALPGVVAEASLGLMQRVAEFGKRFVASMRAYHAHPVFRASLAYALLYISVLSLGGIMTSWLKLRGVSDALLAGVRSIAALVGVLATYVSPWMIRRWGLLQSALLSIWLQVLLLLPVALSFVYYFRDTSTHLVILFVFLCASRFGLWSFDLAETQIMQSRVDPAEAGAINGAQEAAINCCYTLGFVLTMVFHNPAWFVAPACISFLSVLVAALIYTSFVTEQMHGANPFPKLDTLMLHRRVEFDEQQHARQAQQDEEQQYAEDRTLEVQPSSAQDDDDEAYPDEAYPDEAPQLHEQASYRYEEE